MKNSRTRAARAPIKVLLSVMTLLALSSSAANGSAEALLQAARDGNSKVALILAESGVDVRQVGRQGETALHWAAFHGLHALARVLIGQGALVNARVNNGNTPLHQAAYNGHLKVVKLLVASGAEVGATNRRNFTATQWAHRNGHATVLEYLLEHGGRLDPLAAAGGVDRSTPAGTRTAERADSNAVAVVRARARDIVPSGAVRRLSTRLGDLPPLVLKIPDASSSARLSLALTSEFGTRPLTAARRYKQRSPAISQPSHEDTAWIQLGAFRVRARADTAWRNTISAHQDLVSGLEPTIVSARVGGNDTFHRLRVGPLPTADAHRLCGTLQARRSSCLVIARPGQ